MVDIVSDIKSRLSIEDVVSQYVQLKKAGRSFQALCPFHSEKTPSFVVSPEKQICHCFGCNKGGDIFAFIQEVEGATFSEALEILADRAGIKIEADKFRRKEDKSEKDEYYKAHELACEFFEKQLHSTNDGKKVLEYLKKRGLKDETIKEFRLGFAPDSYDDLHSYLLKKGIRKEVLMKSGFVSVKNLASEKVYDKFRARLMFPVFDYMGRVHAFGGRVLKSDQSPKYLNSPENIIYNKGKTLYGLYQAKQSIKEEDKAIVVEGYFDVILPYQAGFKNVVASSGTALTSDQVKLIKRLTSNVITFFDTDEAGFEATKRSFFLFQNENILVKTIGKVEQKDPADFILEKGVEFNKLVKESPDFITFFIDKLLKENDISVLEGRKKILSELMPCYKQMTPADRDFFVKKLATELNINEKYLYEEFDSYKLPMDHPARFSDSEQAVSKKFGVQEFLLALLLGFPQLFVEVAGDVEVDDFEEDKKNIYKVLTDQYNSARDKFVAWNFDKGFLAEIRGKIDVLTLYAEERYSAFSESSLELEVGKLVDRMKKDRKVSKLNAIQSEIADAEKSQDKEKLGKLLREYQELSKN